MRHVRDHVLHLVFVRRGSSENPEMTHKEFKCFYNNTNKDIDSIAPVLLTSWGRPI